MRKKVIFKMIALLFLSVLIGALLLAGVYSLPTERIMNNLNDSRTLFVKDENRFDTWTGTWARYAQIDVSTDSLMINTAICREHDSLLDNVLLNPHFKVDKKLAEELGSSDISLFLDEESRNGCVDYVRYWHGYLVYLIPGLIIYNVGSLRTIMLTIQFLLMLVLLYKLSKIDFIYSFIYGITIIYINPITTALNFQNASVYTLSLIFSIIILYFNDYLNQKGRYYLLFALIGITTSYIDLLTYPIVSYGMPAITYLIINKKDYKKLTIDLVLFGLSWIFGYAGMWASKWLLTTLFTDTNAFANAFGSILERSGQIDSGATDISIGRVFFIVYKEFNYVETLSLFLISIVFIVLYSIYRKNNEKINYLDIIPYIVVLLSSFVWAIALRQHYITHQFLEYRTMAVFVLAIQIILYRLLAYKKV